MEMLTIPAVEYDFGSFEAIFSCNSGSDSTSLESLVPIPIVESVPQVESVLLLEPIPPKLLWSEYPAMARISSWNQPTCLPINEAGKKVEAHVAKSPGLSLFRREEPVDGDSDESYALHSYRSKATRLIMSTNWTESKKKRKQKGLMIYGS